ncbi:hypothetical protein [Brucella intermedia]|uniref:hypothetical protein n=1 Tax=Brucella intermedia TaxID=94625 RepID=UPI0015889F0D|nr:hypothetical protein [Brucella intermedia]NYD84317.1 hypothetical protein [Brucella intermedia]
MAVRIYETGNPPRLITSKPGYNASPSLRDDLKTFDSNWFNGGGIKFRYSGVFSVANFVYYYPYALNFVPKYTITGGIPWNNNSSMFFWKHPNSPGFSVDPPSNAIILPWPSSMTSGRAFNNRIEFYNSGPSAPGGFTSILVFEA